MKDEGPPRGGALWAIGVVAQHVLASRAESVEDDWERYPEVGESDWEAVCQHVTELQVYPSEDDYREALKVLIERVDPLGDGFVETTNPDAAKP